MGDGNMHSSTYMPHFLQRCVNYTRTCSLDSVASQMKLDNWRNAHIIYYLFAILFVASCFLTCELERFWYRIFHPHNVTLCVRIPRAFSLAFSLCFSLWSSNNIVEIDPAWRRNRSSLTWPKCFCVDITGKSTFATSLSHLQSLASHSLVALLFFLYA